MKKIIFIVIILALVFLVPFSIKKSVDGILENSITNMKNNGINIKITNTKGFFNSTRKFTLTINDEIKFNEYLQNQIKYKYHKYTYIFETVLNTKEYKEYNKFLKDIIFKGTIENSNIDFTKDIKVNLYLDSLSKDFMDKLKETKNPIRVIFDKKLINFNMIFNKNQELIYTKLNNIDEIFKDNSHIIKTKIQEFENFITPNKDKDISKTTINEIYLEQKDKKNHFVINLKEVKSNMEYKNTLENIRDLSFNDLKTTFNNTKLDLEKMYFYSDGINENDNYQINSKITMHNSKFKDLKKTAKLEDIDLNLSIKNIDYNLIDETYTLYEKINLETIQSLKNRKQISKNFEKLTNMSMELTKNLVLILQDGFNLNIDLNIKKLLLNILQLEKINVKVNAMLNKNNINLNNINQQRILQNIEGKINISMTENDLKNISNLIPPQISQQIKYFQKIENSQAIFNIDISKGQITINNKKL